MLSIAIQAGGRSRRFGGDKALMPLAGKPLIEHLIARVEGLGDEILITTNQPQNFTSLGARLVPDPIPNVGVLAGLHTALSSARGRSVLVLACDMPFISRPLLEYMINMASEADVVVPHHGGNYEPLHAIYNRRKCLPALEVALDAGEKRMISFYPHVSVLPVEEIVLSRLDPRGLSFFNVNTPDDLAQAERLLSDAANGQFP